MRENWEKTKFAALKNREIFSNIPHLQSKKRRIKYEKTSCGLSLLSKIKVVKFKIYLAISVNFKFEFSH